MKKIFAVATFLFLTAQLSFAQLNNNEINNLKKNVKISNSDVVRINERAGISSSASDPVKVFLAIKRNGDEKKYFENWIKTWNEKNGSQYGKIQQVDDIAQAEIVMVQFVSAKIKRVGEAGVKVGNVPSGGQITKQNVSVGSGTGFTPLKLPVYSYLVKRESGIWTVLYVSV